MSNAKGLHGGVVTEAKRYAMAHGGPEVVSQNVLMAWSDDRRHRYLLEERVVHLLHLLERAGECLLEHSPHSEDIISDILRETSGQTELEVAVQSRRLDTPPSLTEERIREIIREEIRGATE